MPDDPRVVLIAMGALAGAVLLCVGGLTLLVAIALREMKMVSRVLPKVRK